MIYKMYCIFAKESLDKIKGVRGKLATQAGHAYLHAYWDAMERSHDPFPTRPFGHPVSGDDEKRRQKEISEWMCRAAKREQAAAYKASERAYKITLVVDTVDQLKILHEAYKDVCGTALITDAGFTVFKEPTTTCLGIGPISEANIGEDLKCLKTLT